MPKGIYKHHLHQGFQKGHSDFRTKEYLDKLSVIMKKRWSNPEFKVRLREVQLGRAPTKGMTGKRHSKVTIEKMSGSNCYLWKGGIGRLPYSSAWTERLKRSIRERDNYICQLCSLYGNHVHHIDYDKENCSLDNLNTLCRGCNSKVNSNRKYWTNYFKKTKVKS